MEYVLICLSAVCVGLIAYAASVSADTRRKVEGLMARIVELEKSDAVVQQSLSESGRKTDSVCAEIAGAKAQMTELSKSSVALHQMVDSKLTEIRNDNERQLEKMRSTVEEKLESTLEKRLSTSFKTVGDSLENVYKQLGEMQTLAKGMNSLEKVLTNVKTRGMWGELQAERILQDIMTPDQYVKNAATRRESRDTVEFAVKMPGRDGKPVLLPIDSKFPRESYERMCNAIESGDADTVTAMRKELEQTVVKEAKDISGKYIDVPNTTDFAVMFLPIEGLYAEILSIPGIQEKILSTYHVIIAGPSTLASLLNSLQMGFRSLAIEKKSEEVWHVLGEVKTEFVRFEDVMKKVQDKLSSASKEVDNVFVRQRVMTRKLQNVESFPELESDD